MKPKALITLLIGALLAGALVAYMVKRQIDPYGNLPTLDINTYQEQPGTLYGNQYLLHCQIDEILHYQENLGRLVAVRDFAQSPRIPVFISKEIDGNVHVGQRYRMKVHIRQQGIIYVEAMQKY